MKAGLLTKGTGVCSGSNYPRQSSGNKFRGQAIRQTSVLSHGGGGGGANAAGLWGRMLKEAAVGAGPGRERGDSGGTDDTLRAANSSKAALNHGAGGL